MQELLIVARLLRGARKPLWSDCRRDGGREDAAEETERNGIEKGEVQRGVAVI